jgi:hypothetical protein
MKKLAFALSFIFTFALSATESFDTETKVYDKGSCCSKITFEDSNDKEFDL